MPDYGFGALALGSGAQAGLQELLKRRLLEREMALRERAQGEEMDYRNRALESQNASTDQMRQFQQAMQLMALEDRRSKMSDDYGAEVSEQTPAGSAVPSAVRGTPSAARIRAIPMAGMDTSGSPAKPLEFMGFSAKEREGEERQAGRLMLQKDQQAARAEQADLSRANTAAIAGMRRDARVNVVQDFDPESGGTVTVGVDPETGEEKWRRAPKPNAQQLGMTQSLKRVQALLDSAIELSKAINTSQGLAAKAKGYANVAAAKANLNDDVAEYTAMLQAFTPLWARAMGHTGVLTQQDVDSARMAFPGPTDSESLRTRKLKRIYKVLKLGDFQDAGAAAPTPTATTKVPLSSLGR